MEETKKKVSIIVPVYGVEKYLRRCIDSLVNQTLSDIEIILINDASPDSCADIMREYEDKYPDKLICIYLQENRKQGGARNIGIKKSTGEYITFVDSDDWVDVTLCEKLYSAAEKDNSDIVFCDIRKVFEATGAENFIMEFGKEIEGTLTIPKKKALLAMRAFPVSKLIRRSVIVDNNLYFAEGIQYEDLAVTPFYFLYAKNASKLNEFLYYYYIRENSTLSTKNSNHHFQRMEAAMTFYEQARKRGFSKEYSTELEMFFIRSYYFYMLDSCLEKFDEVPVARMQEISSNIRRICPSYPDNYYIDKIVDPIYVEMARLNDQSPEKLLDELESLRKRKFSYLNYYRETENRAQHLISYCRNNSLRIAVWGAGQKGKDFLEINDKGNQYIKHVIDGNRKREGEELPTGHILQSFDSVKQDIDVIFVINKNYFGDIVHKVHEVNSNIILINLDMYLIYAIDVRDFIHR